MAKMKLFGLLFSFFNLLLISWTPILASNEMEPARLEQCNLPAPDSFRIKQVGGDIIKLTWNPIFPGAQHQLTVMESDGNGGYATILVENNVSGDTYNADNLIPGTGYRFVIATKCASGDPSEIKVYIDGITLIVDLVISGRKPVNPIPIGDCEIIPNGFNWMGFKVSTFDDNFISENFFEVTKTDIEISNQNSASKFLVKRYGLYNSIVAANDDGIWPDCDQPVITISGVAKFRIDKLINGGPEREIVGFVDLFQNNFPLSYYICPDYDNQLYPWKQNYVFTPLVSNKTTPPMECQERTVDWLKIGQIQQTVFTEEIEIQFDDSFSKEDRFDLVIINSLGQPIQTSTFRFDNSSVWIKTSALPIGHYIFQLKSKHVQKSFRALKPY
ncbi:MAG TPA: fibronectin type III domain-containing protein [Saprospiraceae bacterium]|nr:fibronectin type III domain-containing protein [Saprospiraceae bacterium]